MIFFLCFNLRRMRICRTCSSKPIAKKVYLAKMQKFFEEKLPKTPKRYHQSTKSTYRIEMKDLKPNSYVFYFGTKCRDFRKPIISMDSAYSNLQNSGVTKTDTKGRAVFYLRCPQIYRNENGKVYSRHFHFLYWNGKKGEWSRRVLTHQIFCDIHQSSVKKYMKSRNVILVDALPKSYYEKKHIEGAINLPVDERWNKSEVIRRIKKVKKNVHMLSPMILYCYSKDCDAAEKVYEKLNKMGFYNTLHYVDGISKWNGKIESKK